MNTYNPFHFVPVPGTQRWGQVGVAEPIPGHELWDDTYSGRIVCRLQAVTPLVVGAEREIARDGRPAIVHPYLRGGKPAIPRSTLRGVISSVAEAASNSALRVLTAAPYSYRVGMRDQPLSALGMIVREETGGGEGSGYRLRPISLPALKIGDRGAELPRNFDRLYPEPNLRVYVGEREFIEQERFPYRTYRADRPEYFGLRLRRRIWRGSNPRYLTNDAQLHTDRANQLLLAQTPLGDQRAKPIPWDDVEKLPERERDAYQRGIMRVLGVWDRDDVPRNKKHELFLPYPPDAERSWPTIPISRATLERFLDLADQRTDAGGGTDTQSERLPYEPRDTLRNSDPDSAYFRLKHGDLVFFRPTHDGREVAEISLSSIWRRRIETDAGERATAHTFFASLDPELLPFDHHQRQVVTLAERLFGFVSTGSAEDTATEDDRSSADEASPGLEQPGRRALAGRVRFSDARVVVRSGEDLFDPPTRLRILASPKPPSPSLYFKPVNASHPGTSYIAKAALRAGAHAPQGRKFYLHHPGQGAIAQPWATSLPADGDERWRQRIEVQPVRTGTVFYFHVDFENLTREELSLLCFALRPTGDAHGAPGSERPGFLHKLGMGKPLGLGSVRVDPIAILRVPRQERYRAAGFFAARYAGAWLAPGLASLTDEIRASAGAECPEVDLLKSVSAEPDLDLKVLVDETRGRMADDVCVALDILGRERPDSAPITTPLVEGGSPEEETYRWFVANDVGSGSKQKNNRLDAARTALPPLTAESRGLPTLPRHKFRES